MLAKSKRLTKAEFDHYFKIGKRHHSPNLQLIYVPSATFSGAAVVGKKVFKQAVKRNQLRRRLYGVLYRHYRSGAVMGVCIIIAKPSAKTVGGKDLLVEANSLIAQCTPKNKTKSLNKT